MFADARAALGPGFVVGARAGGTPGQERAGTELRALKRRVGRVGGGASAAAKASGFVELRGAQLLGPASGAVVEVVDADGGRLTIQLGTGSELDVAELVEAFRRRRA